MMKKFAALFAIAVLMLLPGFVSATKMKSFWRNPEATKESLQLNNILVIAVIKQPMTRKVAEDKAVRIIEEGKGAKAVASYNVLGENELDDKETAKAKIEKMGFDGVIIMRSAGSKDQKKYEEPDEESTEWSENWSYYYDVWGYYSAAWGAVYNSATTNDLTVYIETTFYSLKESKLIWSGITATDNPDNPAKVVGEIAEQTTKYLQKEGLIAKKK